MLSTKPTLVPEVFFVFPSLPSWTPEPVAAIGSDIRHLAAHYKQFMRSELVPSFSHLSAERATAWSRLRQEQEARRVG